MLRFWLLGGRRPSLPWEFFVTMGGALLLSAVLFAILFPLWTSYPLAGGIEAAVFVAAGATLLVVGIRRRRRV